MIAVLEFKIRALGGELQGEACTTLSLQYLIAKLILSIQMTTEYLKNSNVDSNQTASLSAIINSNT